MAGLQVRGSCRGYAFLGHTVAHTVRAVYPSALER